MANVSINYDEQCIEIDLGDLAPLPNINSKKALYKRNELVHVNYPHYEPYLQIVMSIGPIVQKWNISTTGGEEVLPIDSINGITPTDLDHLYDLVKPIIHT